MRKIVSILLFVALATVLTVGTVSAAITGSTHDMTVINTGLGTCSACHIPHKSAGPRLWASSMGATTDDHVVGSLCAACHSRAGGYAGVTVEASYAGSQVLPSITTTAHRLVSNAYTWSAGADELSAYVGVLPYMAIGGTGVDGDAEDAGGPNKIQCTTCHNVHDNTQRPFLRRSVRDLCVTCHKDRGGSAGDDGGGSGADLTANWAGNWGISNYGSHPVGPDVTTTSGHGTHATRAQTITFAQEWFQVFESGTARTGAVPTDASGIWNLGRHTAAATDSAVIAGSSRPGSGIDGGVVCVSCHAVHGYQPDNTATTGAAGNLTPVGNLLGITQGVGPKAGMTYDGDIYDGNLADGANFLCEACHHISPASSTWANAAAWAAGTNISPRNFTPNGPDATSTYTGAFFPNPGMTSYSHPIDNAWIQNTLIVTTFTTNWPYGQGQDAGTGVDGILCESCHTPHAVRNIRRNAATRAGTAGDIKTDASSFLLRDDVDEICNGCHGGSATVSKHHPVGNMNKAVAVAGLGRTGNGATKKPGSVAADGAVGNGDTLLSCGDCHNAGNQGQAAHNWDGQLSGIAVDPDWDADSESCEKCHYAIRDGSADITMLTPTQISGQDWGTEANYQKGTATTDAVGTHFLGDVNSIFGWSNGLTQGGGAFNAAAGVVWGSADFPNATGLGSSQFGSRLTAGGDGSGGLGDHLICESCHELEPTKNAGNGAGRKLLLASFAENTNEVDSFFCEGCHGHNPGMEMQASTGTVTHPLTGSTVSRTGTTPNTTTPWANGIAGNIGNGTYPAFGTVNCDSCHQVHDSATDSATFILDGADSTVGINAGYDFLTNRGGGSLAANHVQHPRGIGANGVNYDGFCQQCHPY